MVKCFDKHNSMFASIPADYNFSVNFMIMIPETSRRNTVNLEPYQMLDMYYLIYFSQPPEEVGILTITYVTEEGTVLEK